MAAFSSISDLILFYLENLCQYNFKKFKNKLSDFSYEHHLPIPRGPLEDADCIATKDLLVNNYGERKAVDVTIEVINLMGLQGVANDLQMRVPQDLRKQYMEWAKEKFQRIKEPNPRPWEAFNLQKRYTPLQMKQGYPDREDKEHEILHKGRRHTQMIEERSYAEYFPMTRQALFNPDKDGVIQKVVVLHGPAGIGKTWASRMIMLDWASGNLYQEKFDFVFYLSCRDLHTMTGEISLVGLLSKTCSLSSGDLEFILKDSGNHGRLLFVIDGFDEFQWTLEDDVESVVNISETTHKDTLLRSLFRKQVLKQSSLLITMRSLAHESITPFIEDSRYVEVKGFSDKDRKTYFYNSFGKKADAEKAVSVIEGNYILFIMCSFPILCWIMCTVLRQGIKKGLDLLKTMTSIYLLYLEGLITFHGRNQPAHACLRKLCALANNGVLNQKILFEEKDLERHGLTLSEVESVFLIENIFHVFIKTQTCYSFIHLSVQEFLAALYYVLDDGNVEKAPKGRAGTSLPEICKGGSLPELCKKHPHLSFPVQFLLGLLYEKRLQEFSKSTRCKISLRARSAVEKWLTEETARSALGQWIAEGNVLFSSIDVISCLYETQNDILIRKALPCSTRLALDSIWPHMLQNKSDMKQLCYCLKLCECPLTLSTCNYRIYSEDCGTLSPLLHRCQQLRFIFCRFLQRSTHEPCEFFSSDKSAGLSWLVNAESKIQESCLSGCYLSPPCCDDLRSALTTNPCLTKLDLSCNPLEDSGVRRLCEGIRDPRCTLQELSLRKCNLSPSCCDVLRTAILTKQSVTKLDLSENSLEDSGVRRLCAGNSVQQRGSSPLRSGVLRPALISLAFLTVSKYYREEPGVRHSCEGLRDPTCTLQDLSLNQCHLTALCCEIFRSAFISNRCLIKLDLSQNNLQDSGVRHLCEALRDPNCPLQVLSLQKCHLSPSCCEDLRSTLVINQCLIRLDLSENNLEDSGVRHLCEGLRDPHCTLQELRFNECDATISCSEDLCSVISPNSTLTYLYTSLNFGNKRMSDPEVSSWCEELRCLGFSVRYEV
ncbi:NACHT, LRR and PYD domains-containing protein 3-like [Gastrophryne carolinensis]